MEGNKLAYCIAKIAHQEPNQIWMEDVPHSAQTQLYLDKSIKNNEGCVGYEKRNGQVKEQ